MGRERLNFIHKECDRTLAQDRSLTYTSFIIEYSQDGITNFDIVASSKQSEIFDYYWDLYKKDLINMSATEGRVNPRTWQDPNQKKKKSK